MEAKNPIIELKNLNFSIEKVKILKDINFSVQRGEYISIIGPNGSGKTTLLKCIDRIYRYSDGLILIEHTPLNKYKQKDLAKLVGYVPQASGDNCPFTVYEFVLMGRYPYLTPFSPPTKEDDEAVFNALTITGTECFVERALQTLSGGERQKVIIAAAIAQGPKILLLDEPTTFLDPRHQEEIQTLMEHINRDSDVTIIASTHDINSAISISHRILALKGGELVFFGTPHEILEKGLLNQIYEKNFLLLRHPQTGATVVL